MQEKEFLKSVIKNRNSHVNIWYFVASWACEVTVILTQKSSSLLLCVRISMTSQAQLATITSIFVVYDTF